MNSLLPVPVGEDAPGYRKDPLRIACVQIDPKLRDVKGNREKILRMTAGIRPGSLDLLVLPEMVLSGYMYTNPTSIIPFLEPTPPIPSSDSETSFKEGGNEEEEGPTLKLCRDLSRRIGCYTVAGYPEVLPSPATSSTSSTTGSLTTTTTSTTTSATDPNDLPYPLLELSLNEIINYTPMNQRVGYNSVLVTGRKGEVVGGYRKSNLYYTDMWWSKPGPGFTYIDLPPPINRLCMGICMDMNPQEFSAPWDAYELASFVKKVGGDVLVVPMNWLAPSEDEPPASSILPPLDSTSGAQSAQSQSGEPEPNLNDNPEAPEESTLNFWASRLTPLHDPSPGYEGGGESEGKVVDREKAKEVVFVGCNRVGVEEGITFAGTSCVMTIESEPKSRIELIEVLGRKEEAVLFATIN